MNDTLAAAPPVSRETLPQLFARAARRYPDSTAVVQGERRLTYAGLAERANRLARHLAGFGVGPEVPVGLFLHRSPELPAVLQGVLNAGGVYVPLDPELPAARLDRILAATRAPLVLTTSDLAGRLPAGSTSLVLDDPATVAALRRYDARPVGNVALHPEHTAYIVFTSGSTGTPKGVPVPHRAIVNHLAWIQDAHRIGPADRTLLKTPFSYDASVIELIWPLLHGATMVVAQPGGHRDPAYLVELISAHRVTVVEMVPSMLGPLLREPAAARCDSLRVVFSGGEALTTTQAAQVRAVLGAPTSNQYGPAETTNAATEHLVRDAADAPGAMVPIGRPVWHTRLHVLDDRLRPVPVGVPGELYIAGIQLARGYLHRPGLTAERFVPEVAGPPGERMYRTGDLVKWNEDGQLEFAGRVDDQVKLRGQRIEPGEIEAVLAAHGAVAQAVVTVREDEPGDRRLVAYVVTAASAPPGLAATLRAHAAAELPEHMVPAAVVVLDAIPATVNGKVDRAALPRPDYAVAAGRAPANPREELLCAAFAEVLGVPRVGADDSFFALGGHSLLLVRLAELLRVRGVPADVRSLFTMPTPAELAAATVTGPVVAPPTVIPPGATALTPAMVPLAGLTAEQLALVTAAVPGGAAAIADVYRLGPLQDGLFFHHRLHEGRDRDPYLLRHPFRVASRKRLDEFLAACRTLLERHEVLRTSLAWEGLPHPVQVVHRTAELPVTEVTVAAAGDDGVRELLAACDTVMDLRRAPLMDVVVAPEPGTGHWLLVWRMHHVTQDHTTGEVLLEELAELLAGRSGQLRPPEPYRNYVAQALLGVPAEQHRAWFARLLGDVTEPTAPFGVLEVRHDGGDVAERHSPLDPELAVRLRTVARLAGTSPATVFHVVWARVLAGLTGRDDVVFGTLLFGRMRAGAGVERVPGLFINTLPVRARTYRAGVREAVGTMHAQLAELVVHEHASLADAQRASGVPFPVPLFTTVLNHRHDTAAGGADLAGVEDLGERERTNYPLVVSIDDDGTGFTFVVQAVPAIPADVVLDALHTTTANVVAALAGHPETALHAVDVLDAAERRRVLTDRNDTAAGFPAASLAELFEQQVDRTPHAPAVTGPRGVLTYAELDERAGRLAQVLIAAGVRPEQPVVMLQRKSADVVVGILAVVKAGAYYVPLPDAFPLARMRWVVESTGTAVLLTDRASAAHPLLGAAGVPVVYADDPIDRPASRPGPEVHPDQLAYVMYTSGSTGVPKGVGVSHRSIVAFTADRRWRPEDRRAVLHHSPHAFDPSTYELWLPLLSGGRVVLPPGPLDRAAMTAVAGQVTSAVFAAALFNVLAEEATEPMARLGLAWSGGDVLSPAAVRRLRDEAPEMRVANAYGATEATVISTWFPLPTGEPVPANVPVGEPMDNTRVYVLDRGLRPVPAGVPGEIYLGGPGLARGYLGRPGLTAERFVADVAGPPGTRMYRTGDVGRFRPGGVLEFVGRVDDQVKISGYRVEPAEVVAALLDQPGVAQAAADLRTDDGVPRLVGYVVPGDVAPREVLEALRERLPAYMVPSAVVALDALPLTRNGKLDKAALPAPAVPRGAAARRARNEREERLCVLFAEVLGRDEVGLDDNFFVLGGQSLLATRLLGRIRAELGAECSLRAFFDAPTVAGLAAHLAVPATRRPALTPRR
ncbi:non-ribosomal peptide synthetase [Amycolatopsis sp. CA-126428]|uniref:non-ribosomal peptide synthetase n=1 Tax=Amycolatopsis sp. CA-126428 TaxID=2073158 RepID=UPI000CD22E2F|nr:non-ribosomal peptide synthetase [Amycolatopsis sp. CA-126428]